MLNSDSVSFYKGAPVFKTTLGRSGTFCAIFLSNNADETDLKHEYDHNNSYYSILSMKVTLSLNHKLLDP